MNDIIIGIVSRDEQINNTIYKSITKNNIKYLNDKCCYVGILNFDNNQKINKNVLDICDGIIFQGGSDIYDYHFDILNYCVNNNIPVLGICMGHQIIGLYANKEKEKDLIKVNNHFSLIDKHQIHINKESILYNLFGETIDVNSRHLYKINSISKPFILSAYSNDNIIEAIEWVDKDHWVLGVQWHPEDMDNMEPLYNYFIQEIKRRRKKQL